MSVIASGLFDEVSNESEAGKLCPRCGDVKPRKAFSNNRRFPDGLAWQCKPCFQTDRLIHYYGLNRAAYDALLAEQGGRCAICNIPSSECRLPLAVDHDHSCCLSRGGKRRTCGNCVRGLICENCNRAIGLMHDSPERLRRAAEYLQRPRPAPAVLRLPLHHGE